MESMFTPLQGRMILDCSALLPGPLVGKLLAMRGARVFKIESPERPDPGRKMKAFYEDLNSCKELVEISLLEPAGRERFHELLRQADGLIEGFRPSAKKKLGLDEKTLLGINPKLCIVSLVGYPETSLMKDRAGHDINFQAVTGCLSLFGSMPGLPLADLFGAYDGALAMACLLDRVAREGTGGRVAVSLSETLNDVQSSLVREYHQTGKVPKPGETLFSGLFPCYHIYSTADGRKIAVGAIEHKFWEKVCSILEVPQYLPHAFATGEKGKEVIQGVQAAFSARSWAEWAELFDPADCCVEPVLDYSEAHPHDV